jgi:hypothetical protein
MTKIFKLGTGAENREVEGAYVPLTGDEVVSMNFFGFTPDIFAASAPGLCRISRGARQRTQIGVLCAEGSGYPHHEGKADVRVLETTASGSA